MEEDKLSKAIDLLISEVKIYDQYYCLATSQALKTVLNELDRLQKENEELKKFHIQDNKHLDFIMKNSITVQKVKAKIEELNIAISECEYLDDDDERYKKAVEKDKLCLLNQKRILKQLLESEE